MLLVARLAVLKEITLQVPSGRRLPLDQAYDHLTSKNKQRKVVIQRREAASGTVVKDAQSLGKDLFAKQGPGREKEELFTFLQGKALVGWKDDLAKYEPLAKTGTYPGA